MWALDPDPGGKVKFRETSCPLSIHGLPPLFPTLSPRLDSYLPSQQLPTLLPLLHGLVSLHATATAQQVLLILLYVLVNAYFDRRLFLSKIFIKFIEFGWLYKHSFIHFTLYPVQ